MFYYHVIADEGVIYETNSEYSARMIEKQIKGASVSQPEGDLSVLRAKAERRFGRLWLRGPSSIKEPNYAVAA